MLRNLGFGAVPIHGHMSQPKRLGALNKFKAGERNILVATDVASRGLDIHSVDVIINYDVPQVGGCVIITTYLTGPSAAQEPPTLPD